MIFSENVPLGPVLFGAFFVNENEADKKVSWVKKFLKKK